MNVLGVDVGGTSTRAVAVAADGRCDGYGTTGAGNPTSSGTEASAAAVRAAAAAALERAGLEPADLASVVVAIAGGTAQSNAAISQALAAAGLTADVSFETDVLATYCSGSVAADGYVLVAGTGAVAARISGCRVEVAGDGLGWLMGDAGSGFWIGRRAVRAAAGALDARAPATALAGLVLGDLGIEGAAVRVKGRPDSLHQLVEAVYRLRPVELSRFARLVFDAAARGDRVAGRIVTEASDALATTLISVVVPSVTGPVVLGGSILAHQPAIAARVIGAVRAAGVVGEVATVGDGTVGAAVLALRHAGVTVDDLVFDRVRTTLEPLR